MSTQPQPEATEHLATSSSDSEPEFFGITVEALPVVWKDVRPWIEDALSYGASVERLTVDDLYQQLMERDCQLWLGWKDGIVAVTVTSLVHYPRCLVCRLVIVTGTGYADWKRHLELLEDWARAQGCQLMEAIARPGWERVQPYMKKTHVFLERTIE